MLRTYAINLQEHSDRRDYLTEVFSPFDDVFDLNFIDAIDARKFSDKEIDGLFDRQLAYKRYGRTMRKGEIGCTLSHRKCCQEMIERGDNVVLIVEDDIGFTVPNIKEATEKAAEFMDRDEPMLMLLSGDYWYKTRRDIGGGIAVADVFDAVGSYAYMLNRVAAEAILRLPAAYLADDFYCICNNGIKLSAVFPHVIDAKIETFESATLDTGVKQYSGIQRSNMSTRYRVYSYYRGLIKHILYYTKHFEYKSYIG